MCESVLYKCEMITLENAIIFNDDQMVCISIIFNEKFEVRDQIALIALKV